MTNIERMVQEALARLHQYIARSAAQHKRALRKRPAAKPEGDQR